MTKKKAVTPEDQPAAVKTSLFDLTSQYIDLMNLLETSEGDITEPQEDELDQVGASMQEKVDNYYRVKQVLLRREEGLTAEIKHLQSRKTVTQNALARLDRLVEMALLRLDTDTLNGTVHRVARGAVGGKRSVDVLVSSDALPTELVKVEVIRAVDANELREMLYQAEQDPALTQYTAIPDFPIDVVRLPDGVIHLTHGTDILATLKPRGTRLNWS